ncbi:MAG: type IV pili twitching motility protein PilT, partial [Bdellovibrio sp.]|nr:type IV pili twitching motility protein PilT [Bdellovibrio sp.]
HTNSAAKTIDRIIDVFPAGQQQQIRTMLAESLRGVVAQTLFSRADGQGRVAAYEIMRNSKAISNLIREGKVHQITSAMQTGSSQGMVLFEKYIEDLVRKGKVSAADAKTFLGQAGGGDTTVQGTVAGAAPGGRTKVG